MQEFYHCRNLRALRKILREADQSWTEQFLHHGGLKAIFAALSILRKKEVKTGAKDDVVSMLQCEAVECLKAAMNSGYGLEYVISSSERFVDSLVSGTSDGWSLWFRCSASSIHVRAVDDNWLHIATVAIEPPFLNFI